MSEFISKTILITGAGGALGSVLCDRFTVLGAKVVGLSRNDLDLSNSAAVDVFSRTLNDQPIDIFIHTAAVHGYIGEFVNCPADEMSHVMQVNFYSALRLIQAILPYMIRQKNGRIINLSGGGGTNSRPYFTSYAASKAAMIRFSECLADELKGKGVTVNCVAPGVMPSKLYDEAQRSGYEKGRPLINSASIDRAVDLCLLLSSSTCQVTGKIISAQWDDWNKLDVPELYTLRRTVPSEENA